jgi:hypothetical protein
MVAGDGAGLPGEFRTPIKAIGLGDFPNVHLFQSRPAFEEGDHALGIVALGLWFEIGLVLDPFLEDFQGVAKRDLSLGYSSLVLGPLPLLRFEVAEPEFRD